MQEEKEKARHTRAIQVKFPIEKKTTTPPLKKRLIKEESHLFPTVPGDLLDGLDFFLQFQVPNTEILKRLEHNGTLIYLPHVQLGCTETDTSTQV